jgi:hypothetical protein
MSDDMKSATELLAHFASAEFRERVAVVAAALETPEGADASPQEIADNLGIPLEALLAAAAAWHCMNTGRAVLITPPAPDRKSLN